MGTEINCALEVLFAPAEFEALGERDLSGTVCVVFDVLRATSTMITALGHGAAAILPVETIEDALRSRRERPGILLAGERNGLRILAGQTGGLDFDLGNSPREFTPQRVEGKMVAMTTTNGTRALRACARGRQVLLGSFLNLAATADYLLRANPQSLLLVCAGTYEQAAEEDVLGAGALADLVWSRYEGKNVSDSVNMARKLYELAVEEAKLLDRPDLLFVLKCSRNGRRLFAQPDLRDDVAFCAQRNLFDFVAQMEPDGLVRRVNQTGLVATVTRV